MIMSSVCLSVMLCTVGKFMMNSPVCINFKAVFELKLIHPAAKLSEQVNRKRTLRNMILQLSTHTPTLSAQKLYKPRNDRLKKINVDGWTETSRSTEFDK